MKLRKYRVIVTGNVVEPRAFFSLSRAVAYAATYWTAAHLFVWCFDRWMPLQRIWLVSHNKQESGYEQT